MANLEMGDQYITFYVFDDLNRLIDCFTLNSNSVCEKPETNCGELYRSKRRKKFLMVLRVDGYFLSVFSCLIKMSEVYPQLVLRNLLKITNPPTDDKHHNVKIRLVKPKLEVLDYAWNYRVSFLIFERQELEHAMSWLSTLGGAFSALGDSFENCAKVASKISVQQFKIAFRLGEPPLVARCKLYMALSLIQLGKFSLAKKIVLNQYEYAKNSKDFKLQNMCKGIWAKLQYIHKEQKKH